MLSGLSGVSDGNFKIENQFQLGLNRNWLNFVFKFDLLKVFLTVVDRG